jgi:hypothetical protein
MSSRIEPGAANCKLWRGEEIEDFIFESQSEKVNPQYEGTSSTSSGSERGSPSKTHNLSKISPKKIPLGLNLNKSVSPLGRNPDVARLARLSASLQTAMGICREKAQDTFIKGVEALNEEEDEMATEYAQRSNEYVIQFNAAKESIAKVQARILCGLDVVPTQKS